MKAKQRSKLNTLAAREHVSVAEINRRAIDAYELDALYTPEQQELEQLAEAVIKSNAVAIKAVKDAQRIVTKTLQYFKESAASGRV